MQFIPVVHIHEKLFAVFFFFLGQDSLATTIKYQRYGPVCEGNSTLETYEVKNLEAGKFCLHLDSNLNPHNKNCTVMGNLKKAPVIDFNFSLLSFSLYIPFKNGIATDGEPIPLE